jgi:hypothetical protein
MTQPEKQPARTLLEIIEKFEFIGLTVYNGKYEDNVLNIFEELEPVEKKVMLSTLYHMVKMTNTASDLPAFPQKPRKRPMMDEEDTGADPKLDPETIKLRRGLTYMVFGVMFIMVLTATNKLVQMLFEYLSSGKSDKLMQILKMIF